MTIDYRALCAELEDAYTWCIEKYMTAPAEEDTLIQRARAALAQPVAEGPEGSYFTDGDFLANYPEVTRVELIADNGREFVQYGCSNVQVSLQDDGQTIKVFLFSTLKEGAS